MEEIEDLLLVEAGIWILERRWLRVSGDSLAADSGGAGGACLSTLEVVVVGA
jgi:hypothetical protein